MDAAEENGTDESTPDGEREIGGVLYRVKPLPFSVGRKMLVKLLKIMGPLFAAAFKGAILDKQLGAKEVGGPGMISEVMATLPVVLTDEDLADFSRVFGSVGSYFKDGAWLALTSDNKKNAQEYHFAGRYLEYMRWLTFNIEVNYGGFFAGVASGGNGMETLATMMGAKKTAPPSDVSNGGSNSNGA